MKGAIKKLNESRQALREALKFYRDVAPYCFGYANGEHKSHGEIDGGDTAKEALAADEERFKDE